MKYPLITVLMPVYNVEDFIEESVNSIITQSYRNLEIIIVDDCSTDSTYLKLQKIAAVDGRIRLFKNESNKKIVETLNFGLSKSQGEYIVRMDGDDTCTPDRIAKMYNYLNLNPDVVLVGCNINTINENGEYLKSYSKETNSFKMVKYCKYATPVYHIWMTKKSIYTEIGGYRMPYAEDYDFLLRVLSRGLLISNINECLYNVRVRNGNTVSTAGMKQHLTVKYAYKLYKERLRSGTQIDSFTYEELERVTSISKVKFKLFKKSVEYYMRGINLKNNSPVVAVINLIISFLLAPVYRFELLYNKFMIKFI